MCQIKNDIFILDKDHRLYAPKFKILALSLGYNSSSDRLFPPPLPAASSGNNGNFLSEIEFVQGADILFLLFMD